MVMSNKAKFTKDQRRARITGGVGPCRRRTQLLEDQLDRADAGRRWQIADRRRCSGGATWKAAARGTSVRELRVRFVVEP